MSNIAVLHFSPAYWHGWGIVDIFLGQFYSSHSWLLVYVEDDSENSLNLREVRQRAESKAIRIALMKNFGNISRAAEQLGVTRPTLYDLLNKYGLSAEAYSKRSANGGAGK